MAELRINISNLSEGSHTYLFETEPSNIGLDRRFVDKLKVEVALEKTATQMLLQASIKAQTRFSCDRCLEEYEELLQTHYSMVYVSKERTMEGVCAEDELRVLSAESNYIDLDDDVRQFIELTVPQKLLCKENCLGICPVCGGNKNIAPCTCIVKEIDSRWEGLKKFSQS